MRSEVNTDRLEISKRFSKFTKFVSRSVFAELQLTQISLNFQTFCCNLKIRGLEAKNVWLFHYFYFERNCYVLKSKIPCIFIKRKCKA